MQWALTRRRIKSTEVQQTLHKHQVSIHAQSTLWLSKAQAVNHYRLQCHGGVPITVESLEKRTIFSLAEYSPNERKALLSMQPPPASSGSRWLLLKHASSDSSTVVWSAATLKQYFQASLFSPMEETSPQALLVDAGVALPSSPSRTVFLFNAQETSNPFLVDDTLHHTHYITGAPFPHILASALSTLWSQFGYTSLSWVPADEMLHLDGITLKKGEEPHQVFDLEPVDLVHIHQINSEKQKEILHAAPRWALLRSLNRPVIFFKGRWLTWRQMNLSEDMRVKAGGAVAPNRRLEGVAANTHQIWLSCDDNTLLTGLPQRRHIVHRRYFYNSSQFLL
ncbi:hypothetical protein DQ04_09681030 [Trypanosoma grayi]|uniref:hypothetical protein n=1 Tax=Trypanosoma grayi TaxID=71804 RepID=UPI0004F42C0C|nr:hypothetical protein DQ04_09681030 [Trypanosoma grayi]KEG07479.1 hypothetical protein DQ04_09681030 [Trypanosoma grayi]